MPSPFLAIEIGPFSTAYHRGIADDVFRAALVDFIEATVSPQVTEAFDAVRGKVSAEFDSERRAGPNSAVRNFFQLELVLVRQTESDELKCGLRYDPVARAFSPRRRVYLWTAARKARFKLEEAAIRRVCGALVAHEVSAADCPRCGRSLGAALQPALVEIVCDNGCFRYNFHRDAATGEFLHGHFLQGDPPY